jgi:Polyketide cyclase / dehydrase and lipid transport
MMDTPTTVDRNAPVLAHHEIDISAPVSRVWALHQDVNAWPTWQSDITAAQLNGAFAPGGSFTWTSFGFTVTSTVYALQDQSRVLWGGTGDGITGVHEWVFTAAPAGTHVETTESFAGAPVEADAAGMQRLLDGSLASWLNHLKNAAEAAG